MKILHLTCVKELSQGIKNQLIYENQAAKELQDTHWHCIAIHNHQPDHPFERQVPFLFRGRNMRRFYGWLYILKASRKYDIVLVRHMTSDFFSILFGWFVPNRVSIHHAKEAEELALRSNWLSKIATWLEKITGKINAKQVKGILGVTGEIAHYEKETHGTNCPIFTYPNGIDFKEIELLEDCRHADSIQIAFVSVHFATWQGLDRLIEVILKQRELISQFKVTFHIIGSLTNAQLAAIEQVNRDATIIISHGHKTIKEYRSILFQCDVGIGSLAMDRKNLKEGATLKVREYLAQGLAVYATHKDSALPDNYLYFKQDTLNLKNLIEFAISNKKVSRCEIRESSMEYIEKKWMMKKVTQWLRNNILSIS